VTEKELFREQARDAYSRDFGTRAVLRDEEDDLDRRERMPRWPVMAAVFAITAFVVAGLVIRIPVTMGLTPVRLQEDRLLAVPSDGTRADGLAGATIEVRYGDREIPVTYEGTSSWDFGNRRVDAVTLRAAEPLPSVSPSELTVVVTTGERPLLTELISSGGVTGS
jgi:hypothetical protein